MAAEYRIIFFLEDSAQEAIVPALFKRLIIETGLPLRKFSFDILNSRGGGSLGVLKSFVKDSRKLNSLKADLLVVGSDANCKGYTYRRDWVRKQTSKSPYHDVITAIPDPHIERWYLLDVPSLASAARVSLNVSLPIYKCDKNQYKVLLRNVFNGTDVKPPLGGVEYGELVAQSMDLYTAGKKDHGFADFIESVRAWLKGISR